MGREARRTIYGMPTYPAAMAFSIFFECGKDDAMSDGSNEGRHEGEYSYATAQLQPRGSRLDEPSQDDIRYAVVGASPATGEGDPVSDEDVPAALGYEVMAQGDEATVCATAPLSGPRSEGYQSEAALEEAFIAQLVRQGYERLHIHSEAELVANLRAQLQALNGIAFTDAEWSRFFSTCIASKNDGIAEKTRRIQEDHIQPLQRDDGTVRNIRLIDKRNIHNNRLQVLNQYVAEGGTHENRYDVTILVNGLPLVHVELKRRGVSLREAFNQIERYQRDSFWSGCGLYEYVQIFVISNGTFTKYYSNTTRDGLVKSRLKSATIPVKERRKTSNSWEFTMWWAAADNKPIQDLVPFTATFFSKHTLLSILTRYCVFTEEGLLMVMRPYQIVACERILNRILVSEKNPRMLGTTAAGGFVWHTTGSGKTLTSFKTARLASRMEGVDKVLFVVDRKDLDYQTMREYDRFEKGAVDGSASTAVLARNLSDPSKRILVTTIQKLSVFIKGNRSHPVYSQHVVIIFDECHRSQFGDMHAAIVKHFKNYHLFGFTGTPIFPGNASSSGDPRMRTTAQIFGGEPDEEGRPTRALHTYTIVDAIRDGNVLPFKVDYVDTIGMARHVQDGKVYDIAREEAFMDARRIHGIVRYILDHFDQKTKRDAQGYTAKVVGNVGEMAAAAGGARRSGGAGAVVEQREVRTVRGFNSILCVASVDMAKMYYTAFAEEQAARGGTPLKVGLIYSFSPNEADEECGLPEESFDTESLDTPSRDFLDAAIGDYNRMFGTEYDTSVAKFQNYYKDVSLRMKNRELDLLIVVNMFLTGFDATMLNTLWVDKNLREHGLIQAFSRTNRILNSVKDHGEIVCFRNLKDEVSGALSRFGDKDASAIVLVRPYADYLAQYEKVLRKLRAAFPPGEPVVGEAAEREFVKLFGTLLRLLNLLRSFDEFEGDNALSARDEQDYRSTYLEIYERLRPSRADAAIVNDDLEFEIELMESVSIGIDYILMLVACYHESHGKDREVWVDIEGKISGDPQLRSKKDLIMKFIESLHDSDDVDGAWRDYVREAYERELAAVVQEEQLDEELVRAVVARALEEGGVSESGTAIVALMRAKPSRFGPTGDYAAKKNRVRERLQALVERFSGLGVTGE